MKLTYIKHSCFIIENDKVVLIIDPFYDSIFDVKSFTKSEKKKYVLLTHAHDDHISGLFGICDNNTTIITNYETSNYLKNKYNYNCVDLNIGGKYLINKDIKVVMVQANHSNSLPSGNYAGLACGYIIYIDDEVIYHMGDTSLFTDMKLINKLHKPTIGLIPIGGYYTMDVEDATFAIKNYFDFKLSIPMHYNTFGAIKLKTVDNTIFDELVYNESIIS